MDSKTRSRSMEGAGMSLLACASGRVKRVHSRKGERTEAEGRMRPRRGRQGPREGSRQKGEQRGPTSSERGCPFPNRDTRSSFSDASDCRGPPGGRISHRNAQQELTQELARAPT